MSSVAWSPRARPKPSSNASDIATVRGPSEVRRKNAIEDVPRGWGSDCRRADSEAAQALHGRFQCLASAGKVEAKTLPPCRRIGIETRARHRGDTAIRHQVACKGDVIREAESRDVGHHVIRAAGREGAESRAFQRRYQVIPACPVVIGE